MTTLKHLVIYVLIVTLAGVITGIMRGFGYQVTAWDCVTSMCLWWLISKEFEE